MISITTVRAPGSRDINENDVMKELIGIKPDASEVIEGLIKEDANENEQEQLATLSEPFPSAPRSYLIHWDIFQRPGKLGRGK